MTITVGVHRSRFSGDVPVDVVDAVTSCYRTGYRYTKAYGRRLPNGRRAWDGKIHLFSPSSNTLPTGLVPSVVDALSAAGVSVTLLRDPSTGAFPVMVDPSEPLSGGIVPRDYQVEGVRAILTGHPHVGQRGVLRIPTGGGKTACAAMLFRSLGRPGVILVHGQQLADQTRRELARFLDLIPVGLVMAEDFVDAPVVVASVDTLGARLSRGDGLIGAWLRSRDVLIADECHRSKGAKTYQAAMDACPARVRVGLSGTPFQRADDADLLLMSRTGPLLFDVPPTRLQGSGHLCRADLLIYEVTRPAAPHLTWKEAVDELVFGHAERTRFLVDVVRRLAAEGRRVLLFGGNSVAYVGALKDEWFRRERLDGPVAKAMFVTGSSGRDVVSGAVDRLRSGEISVLCHTKLLNEGTDVPAVDAVVLAAPAKGFVQIVQRVGRGLRAKEGKLLVVDVFDTNNPYLTRHASARLKVYESEKIFDSIRVEEASLGDGVPVQTTLGGDRA